MCVVRHENLISIFNLKEKKFVGHTKILEIPNETIRQIEQRGKSNVFLLATCKGLHIVKEHEEFHTFIH